jgi:hypothetical protein
MERKLSTFLVVFLVVCAHVSARAQEPLLRITSPENGAVVPEGKPLLITVSASPSVRLVGVLAWQPLPYPRQVGPNQFEMTIPETVPAGSYNLTAVGVTTTDVESEPVTIHVEREQTPTGLQVRPPFLSFPPDKFGFPIRVEAYFRDGSHIDVTHSAKTSFEPKDPAIATVDQNAMVVAVAPGQTYITVRYETALSAVVVFVQPALPKGPAPEVDTVTPETGVPGVTDVTVTGRNFGAVQGKAIVAIGSMKGIVKSWSDTKIIATIAPNAHKGSALVLQNGLYSNAVPFVPIGVFIDGGSGKLVSGKQVRIEGSGFGEQQGTGYLTVGDSKAEIVKWSSDEITFIVPEGIVIGRAVPIVVHQNGKSGEFRMISFKE